MKYSLDNGAYPPQIAHEEDGGIDLRSNCTVEIPPRYFGKVTTGVHIEIPRGYAGLLVAKSGLNVKHGVTSTGLIDSGYSGEIIVNLYNNSNEPFIVHNGDKVSQLVIIPIYAHRLPLVQVDSIESGERGDSGFGSTGR